MSAARKLAILAAIVCASGQALSQATPGLETIKEPTAQPWEYSLAVTGYIIPDGTSYVNPVFTADENWLHLEARYNYENLRTGSLWAGYNFSWGTRVQFSLTPMIGGVFGQTNGIAPGCEASLTFKKIEASISNEYVFDTGSKSGNFYYCVATTYLLAGGVVACGRRRATYEGLSDDLRHPTRVSSGPLPQAMGVHDLRL